MINIDTELLKPIAAKFNLSLTSFDEVITDPSVPSYGSVVLSNPWGTELEPAPISPYKGSAAFDILSSTIKSVYNTHRGLEDDDNMKVYPTYISGNTGKTDCHSNFSVGSHAQQIPDTTGSCRKTSIDIIMGLTEARKIWEELIL